MNEATDYSAEPQVEKTPDTAVVPVKFNKETRVLPINQAAELAQKGLKYDQILPEFDRLRRLARQKNQTVPAFLEALENGHTAEWRRALEQAAVQPELIDRVLAADGSAEDNGNFAELHAQFPEIASEKDLPESVRHAAEQKNTRLLDEYLRYRLAQQRARKNADLQRRTAEQSTIGSMRQPAQEPLPLAAEFLRGVWGQ